MKKTNRTFKRFAAITSASLLAACAMAPVFTSMTSYAATGTGSITVNEADGVTSSIKAYQIFTADVDGNTVTITNWGNGIDVANLSSLVTNDETEIEGKKFKDYFTGATFSIVTDNNANIASAQSVAKVLSDNTSNTEFVKLFAKHVANSITGDGKTAVNNMISDLEYGYYVAVDAEAVANTSGYLSKSLGILAVLSADSTTINPKRDYPSFDKQILDKNDSFTDETQPNTEGWGEVADHDFNDTVSFRLEAVVPTNIDRYDTYKMIFHDDIQTPAFDNINNIKVYHINATDTKTEITNTDETIFTTDTETNANVILGGANKKSDGIEDITVTIPDIKKISNIASGDKIVVEYDATLTINANLGSIGNWNGAYLEYSNNPNVSGGGATDSHETGNSTVDYTVAFTYQAVIDKINGTSNLPLAGAEFTLQKVTDGATEVTETNKIGDAITGIKYNDETTFEFKGLDDGTYILTETKKPNESYTDIAPIVFKLEAGEVETDGSEALGTVTATEKDNAFTSTNIYKLNNGKFEANTNNGTGAIHATIKNTQGSTLPGTGGIGTTIFYLGGGAMAAIGGVYLISKRRMKKSEE